MEFTVFGDNLQQRMSTCKFPKVRNNAHCVHELNKYYNLVLFIGLEDREYGGDS